MPPLSGPRPGPGARPGFAMGLGAGALAAGATIFGDDFISGFDLPTVNGDLFSIRLVALMIDSDRFYP
ncbi:hypothetical protein L1987_71183 [Smallanthus sonchifolius]|uniref:Uncharacterized protein n=1 Tax=Smallanthus sonchifolius TaxID=185202 RepID=A0ACB9ATC9_9ASTR|nr:hypothetical protein L1987_71183 [Smallanthus sonchifolius]